MKNSRWLILSFLSALLLTSCNLLPVKKTNSSSLSDTSSSNVDNNDVNEQIDEETNDEEDDSSSEDVIITEGEIDASKIKDYTIEQIVHSTVRVENYYSSITSSMSGDTLKTALKKIVGNFSTVNYNNAEAYMRDTDRDWHRSPDVNDENPYMILLYYTKNNDTNKQQLWNHYHTSVSAFNVPESQQSWDKEHIWAKSNGLSDSNSDLHHLRASDRTNNNQRSNYPLAKVVNKTKGIIDFSGTESNILGTNNGATVCEPLDQYKGDVARALLYMPLAWNNLSLTNGKDSSGGKWGFLNNLLDWNESDPVDEFELRRNSLVQYYQGNRNPFIDHPEYARKIYG